jgi:hypothetical protein
MSEDQALLDTGFGARKSYVFGQHRKSVASPSIGWSLDHARTKAPLLILRFSVRREIEESKGIDGLGLTPFDTARKSLNGKQTCFQGKQHCMGPHFPEADFWTASENRDQSRRVGEYTCSLQLARRAIIGSTRDARCAGR